MATVLDLATASLQYLGIIAAGETPSSEDAALCLSRLNSLMDQWAGERLEIYSITRTTWVIVSGTGQYTVGTGGTVNIARPVFVDRVKYILTAPDPDLELELQPLTDDAYAKVPQKALTSPYPTCYYYNPTYPLGTLELWPVPTDATLLGVIYCPTAVSQFAALGTTVALPPGYERMIVTNLAAELAPAFQAEINPKLEQQAAESKAGVKRANIRLMDLSVDSAALIGGRTRSRFYNIVSGS